MFFVTANQFWSALPQPGNGKLIIILYYNENYTTKEISKILSMKENTVKSKLFRAKDKIKNNCKGGIKYG